MRRFRKSHNVVIAEQLMPLIESRDEKPVMFQAFEHDVAKSLLSVRVDDRFT